MSSSINLKKKSLSMDFLKKTAGYIGGAAGEYISEALPVTVDTLREAKATVTQISSTLSNTSQQILPKIKNLKTQNPIREIYRWYMDKENEFDDSGLDVNFEFDTDTDAADIAETQISETERSNNKLANTFVESSRQVVESQIVSTANLQSTLDNQSAIITSGFKETNETLNKILEVVTKNTAAIIETNVAGSNKDDPVNNMIKNGKFNLGNYKKMVTNNIKNSPYYSMLQMIPMMASNVGPQDIFKVLLDEGVNRISPKMKENMKALDDVVNDNIMQSLIRLSNNSNMFSAKGIIGQLFGIDTSRKDQSTARSSLEIKSTPFDTITKEAITNTIPGYLRKILIALGGGDEVYDYRSRSFRSKNDIHRDFIENTTNSGSIYNATSKVRNIIGTDDNTAMFYEMLLADIGTKNNRDDILKTFKDPTKLVSYMTDIINTNGIKINDNDIKSLNAFSKNFSNLAGSSNGILDVSMQAAKNNIARNVKTSEYIEQADAYNIDLSEVSDSLYNNIVRIAERSGRKVNDESSVSLSNPQALTGTSYTNAALYQIFRRLDTGINVFQVGSSNVRTKPYKKFGNYHLSPPSKYRVKKINEPDDQEVSSTVTEIIPYNEENKDTNYLKDQVNEDGTVEELTGLQKAGRWAKHRGGALWKALMSGSPEQIRGAFGSIVSDITEVAGDQVKDGASKINTSFGNVTGYLKHKLFGTEYSYQDVDDEGKPITKQVAKNELGGIFGFISDEVRDSFGRAKESTSSWLKDVLGYFDYGDSDPSDKKAGSKRKKFITTAIGAFAGGGLLGGPIGMIVGALGANALSSFGIGDKIKNFLFGHDEKGKPTGLISKAADAFISPIRYQLGKTVTFAGSILKNKVFGPLSDIGLALKDRITNHVDSTFDKIRKGAASIFGKIFGTIGRGLLKTGTNIVSGVGSFLTTTAPGKIARGALGVVGGAVGSVQNSVANKLAGGKTFHKLKNDESYTIKKGEQYLDSDGTVKIAEDDRVVTADDNIKVTTKGYLKQRRINRKNEVNQDLKNSGYYNSGSGLKGFFGGDYKLWKEKDEERRAARRSKLNEYTDEQIESTKETAENTATIAEQTEIAAESAKILADLGSEQGSIFTHDQGLHDRLDSIIDLLDKDHKLTTKSGSGSNDANEFASSAITAAASFAGSGDEVNNEESRLFTSLVDESSKSNNSKSTISQKLKDLMNLQRKKSSENSEDKESSFFSKIKEVLSSTWPYLLGGLALLNTEFREFVINTLSGAGKWITNNLPGIIKGAFEVGADINRSIENNATGATTVTDEVTGQDQSVVSAEEHANKVQNGIFASAVDSTFNIPRLAKDYAIIAGERAVLKAGSTAVAATGGLTAIGGRLANGAIKTGQSVGAFAQGIGQYGLTKTGLSKGLNFAKSAWNFGGSNAATAAANAGTATAKGAKGFSEMLGSAFKPSKWVKNPTAVASSAANLLGGLATDAAASLAWDTVENARHDNIVGDYGLGNAGGYIQTNTTAKTLTTTSLGTVGGIAIGAAVKSAITGVGVFAAANGWNPVGWAAMIISGVIIAAAAIAAAVNAIINVATDSSNKDYAIRSNSSKLQGVIDGKVSYVNGKNNPMYVYCAQESDRVLGLTNGLFIKDPDYQFGKFLKTIADGLASSPGTEVLLYDFINNMAVQGVPFACLIAGDSEECSANGKHANKDILGDPPANRTGPMGGKYTDVRKSKVDKYKNEVFNDIAVNISRQDASCVWSLENLEFVYESGEKVVKALKSAGIIKNNGSIDISKFKGSPNSGTNDAGWKSLDKLTRSNGSYFLTQCLVYINSKIEANKDGKQWLDVRENDIVKLMEGLKDFFVEEHESTIAELKAQGKTDEEIESIISDSVNPKGKKAEEASAQIADTTPISNIIKENKIRSADQADVKKELRLINASYLYSHPLKLKEMMNKYPELNAVSTDNQNNVINWKSYYKKDKKLGKILLREMANTALRMADTQGDIYNLLPNFDFTEGGRIYNYDSKSPGIKYGGDFVLRDKAKGPSTLDTIWNGSDPISEKYTPENIHNTLYGKEEHGKASESTSTSDQDMTIAGSGLLAYIANNIANYGSAEGRALTAGDSKDKWRNVLVNLPVRYPKNLSIGGPIESSIGGELRTLPILSSTGNSNPLNKSYTITSNFGYRDLNGDGVKEDFHRGVDLVPADGSKEAEVQSRFSGTVTAMKTDVPNSHTGLNVSTNTGGNYVTIETPDGLRIKNMHLKAGSIPHNLSIGSKVNIGDKIGDMGNTGRSTGPHLHYQIEKSPYGRNDAINPLNSMAEDYLSNSNEEPENKSAWQKFIDSIKNAGTNILNAISGGLFNKNTDTSNTDLPNENPIRITAPLLDYDDYDDYDLTTRGLNKSTSSIDISNEEVVYSDAASDIISTNATSGNVLDLVNAGNAEGNAKIVYQYFKSRGIPDVNIAGILGNWVHESGIDPTAIESIYGKEKYEIGPTKSAALKDTNAFVQTIFKKYADQGISINKDAYKDSTGTYYPGLGLGQFTGPAAAKLISFAKKHGGHWYDLGPQLKFSIDKTSDGGYRNFMSGWTKAESTPSAAAKTFLSKWEGITNTGNKWVKLTERQKVAKEYYNKMQNEWKKLGIGGSTIEEESTFGPSTTKTDDLSFEHIGGPIDDISSIISESKYVSSDNYVSSKNNRSNSSYESNVIRSTYKTPTHTAVSDNNHLTFQSQNIFNDENIVGAIYELLIELRAIRKNTGSSSELLADLNSKDFVDKGLRDSINALGSVRSKSSASAYASASRTNVSTVQSIARP